jgi:hypothetical protein
VCAAESPIPAIDPAILSGLARAAANNPRLEIGDWEAERLVGGFQLNSSIYRLHGRAAKGGASPAWSLVLKTVRPDPQYDNPGDYRYWKREALAYQSGVLDNLPGPVAAPRCYDVCERPDGSVWLFLEDLPDEGKPPWSLEQYAEAARCLGEFNGAYLAGRTLPEAGWVRPGWLRDYLAHARPAVEFVREHPHHPVVRDIFPGITLALTLAYSDACPRLLDMLDGLPQTFCHQDAFERNLFLRGGQVAAIDWAYAGVGPAGAELAPLIAAATGMGGFPAVRARDLDRACFYAYVDGLRRAGWQPDVKQVRLAFTLTYMLRYILGNALGETIPSLLDEERRAYLLRTVGNPIADEAKADPDVVAYSLGVFRETLRQLGVRFTLRLLGRTLRYMIRLR